MHDCVSKQHKESKEGISLPLLFHCPERKPHMRRRSLFLYSQKHIRKKSMHNYKVGRKTGRQEEGKKCKWTSGTLPEPEGD